jgi:hypothetical protein
MAYKTMYWKIMIIEEQTIWVIKYCREPKEQINDTWRQINDILEPYLYWNCRSQWPCSLRRRSVAARLLGLWVRIPPVAWIFVCCEYCVLSGRGLCDELIIRPEDSYRLWCVVVCDLETSRMRRSRPVLGHSATPPPKKKKMYWNHIAIKWNFGNISVLKLFLLKNSVAFF